MGETHDANVRGFGFWAALGTGVTTAITFLIAILTPPLSGSLCRGDCLRYPYLEISSRFPRDYYWMLPALPGILCFLAFMLALSARRRAEGRPLTRFGVLVAMMGGVTLLGDYYIQLTVVQPSLVAGESEGIPLLTQYNPHGLFIALEELGYLLISLALACMIPALSNASRLERVVRWLFGGGLIINLAALAFFVSRFGHGRGYLFEITVISVDWLVLIAGAFLMTAVYRRELVAGGRRSPAQAATL